VAVAGDRVRAADLAAVAPEFAALPPETAFALAPAPGARRTVSRLELQRWAGGRLGESGGGLVCLERRTAALTREQVLAGLERGIRGLGVAAPAVRLGLIDFGGGPAPAGEVLFPASGLQRPPGGQTDAPVQWQGRVRYDGNRSVPIWARVRLSVHGALAVAARDLAQGRRLEPDDLRLEERTWFPREPAGVASIPAAAGRRLRYAVKSGEKILPTALLDPPLVERGETVTLEVETGGARLAISAKAESAGRQGDLVAVRNPSSGKVVRGRVEEKGRVRAGTEGK
jgi:flagella basal body P-ring formation protein FlgA